jgi:hypothetical protein
MTDIDYQKLVHFLFSDIILVSVCTQNMPSHKLYIKVVLGFELV